MLIGIVKPIPSLPPELLAIAVFIPTTSPRRLMSGPPLLPGIDGRIGLHEILELDLLIPQFEIAAPLGADDSERNGMAQSERTADGQHKIADLDDIAIADARWNEMRRIDCHDGDVGSGV